MSAQSIPRLPKISDYVFHYADLQPNSEALVWNDVRINYRQLANQVSELSRALLAAGVSRGDRVALLGSPRPEFFVALMAVADIGAIWMGLHPRYKLSEFQHVV